MRLPFTPMQTAVGVGVLVVLLLALLIVLLVRRRVRAKARLRARTEAALATPEPGAGPPLPPGAHSPTEPIPTNRPAPARLTAPTPPPSPSAPTEAFPAVTARNGDDAPPESLSRWAPARVTSSGDASTDVPSSGDSADVPSSGDSADASSSGDSADVPSSGGSTDEPAAAGPAADGPPGRAGADDNPTTDESSGADRPRGAGAALGVTGAALGATGATAAAVAASASRDDDVARASTAEPPVRPEHDDQGVPAEGATTDGVSDADGVSDTDHVFDTDHVSDTDRAPDTPERPEPADAKDRLLRVLLTDPDRALRASDDLEACRVQLDRLNESVEQQRRLLADAARRLRGAGLTPAQVARLAGVGEGELATLLAQHAPSPVRRRPTAPPARAVSPGPASASDQPPTRTAPPAPWPNGATTDPTTPVGPIGRPPASTDGDA